MNKGDLVMFRDDVPEDQLAPSHFRWEAPGVVLRGPHEGQMHIHMATSGKNVGTEVTMVVDVMVSGRILKGIPTAYLERVT